MVISTTTIGEKVWQLPPLILHPFNERASPETLLENSRAALVLAGLLPGEGEDLDLLHRRVLVGRYAEIRMLYFVGKDLCRWIGQCMEMAERDAELSAAELRRQSFAGLLTAPPENVREKLLGWGVMDYGAVFTRGIGMNALFQEPPEFSLLAEDFVRNYHRTADLLYRGFMEMEAHRVISPKNFRFELYASGEYAKLLETEWEAEE